MATPGILQVHDNNQLNIKATYRRRFAKHVGLELASRVPQRLAAHGRIECKISRPRRPGSVAGASD